MDFSCGLGSVRACQTRAIRALRCRSNVALVAGKPSISGFCKEALLFLLFVGSVRIRAREAAPGVSNAICTVAFNGQNRTIRLKQHCATPLRPLTSRCSHYLLEGLAIGVVVLVEFKLHKGILAATPCFGHSIFCPHTTPGALQLPRVSVVAVSLIPTAARRVGFRPGSDARGHGDVRARPRGTRRLRPHDRVRYLSSSQEAPRRRHEAPQGAEVLAR